MGKHYHTGRTVLIGRTSSSEVPMSMFDLLNKAPCGAYAVDMGWTIP